jgi:hypothetical protein
MHGSTLTVTSYPWRTSPVKRGKWVLEQLLCASPPPPPPGVEGLLPETKPTGSLRQRMEAHRTKEECAVCHRAMDPIGFGLENFDGIGRWRTVDDGFPVDATGEMEGAKFGGAVELAALIAKDPRWPRCVVQQLLTYALGRGIGRDDGARLDALTKALVERWRMRDLVERIVLDDGFRARRGEPVP